ncbi:C-terminal binding protein [uncultured Agrococcus sp.]|uniref:C-terminal binding protein n=1 Tax=uncultured Agrococcus sp. TaxID=382258 RepID=UPI0025D22022|nr:C-terminal binding protein [uncultured Agrococcus sp.]
MTIEGHTADQPVVVYTKNDDTDAAPGIALLERAGFEVRVLDTDDQQQIIDGAQDAVALLVGYAEIDRRVIESLPNLRLVSLMSMGFNNVDLDAAVEHGVWVTNIPGVATEEVATHALALLLQSVRQFGYYTKTSTANPEEWNSRAAIAPWRLSEQTLGIVGLGKIGRKLAEFAGPLFGDVVGYDPLLPDTDEVRGMLAELGVRRASLEEVQRAANVLSLHVPLTQETERMIDERFIDGMPERALIVNVSRGALLDSQAVADAVRSGRLSGAALDVLEEEPPTADHPLLDVEDVVITPHVAYYSERTEAEYVRIQAQNAVTLVETGKPETPVNTPVT